MFNWNNFGIPPAPAVGYQLTATGQTTQYNSELDDGYYEKGIAKSYTVTTTGLGSGTTTLDLSHLVDSGISFDNASKELRCAGKCGVFKAAGGETIVVSGSTVPGNNAAWTTASADANKVVLTTAPGDEAAGASITVKKRDAMSNNTVYDENTKLTWIRYVNTKFGIAGDGKMPWYNYVYDIFQYCAVANAASLGGYTDWRVPNYLELTSLMNLEAATAAPDAVSFPSWPTDNVWASTTAPASTTTALMINFSNGYTAGGTKTSTGGLYCALVRGG
jgi:hypothetical protein